MRAKEPTFTSGAPGAFARRESRGRRASRYALAAVMVGAGVLHFVVPKAYGRLIPPFLGSARPWVLGSGIVEIAAGALLALPRTRRIGAWATVATFVGVFPGNVYMALEGGLDDVDGFLGSATAAWLRLPLQVPLVLWALAHTRPDRRRRGAGTGSRGRRP